MDPENEGVHEPDRIDDVQKYPLHSPKIFGRQSFVVAGVGVGDAGGSEWDVVELSWVQRLKEHRYGPRLRYLRGIDQLIRRAELTARKTLKDALQRFYGFSPKQAQAAYKLVTYNPV